MCKVSLALPKPLLLVPRVLGGKPLPSMSGPGLHTQGLPDVEIQMYMNPVMWIAKPARSENLYYVLKVSAIALWAPGEHLQLLYDTSNCSGCCSSSQIRRCSPVTPGMNDHARARTSAGFFTSCPSYSLRSSITINNTSCKLGVLLVETTLQAQNVLFFEIH